MKTKFNISDVIAELKHLLPSQTPLKDFIHHNSLHAFQELDFFKAIFTASELFGYHVTFQLNEFRKLHDIGRIKEQIIDNVIAKYKPNSNEQWKIKMLDGKYETDYNPKVGRLRTLWKTNYKINLDNLVQPTLFRIISAYLDQGIALWQFPFEDLGLINALREVEKRSYVSFFKTKRAKALLFDDNTTIESLLTLIVGNEKYFENYLYDQQFGHRGWSGMAGVLEDNPHSLLYQKKISLQDFIILELLLELDNLDDTLGNKWLPICESYDGPVLNIHDKAEMSEAQEVLKLWQLAFEWDYYDEVLAGLILVKNNPAEDEYIGKNNFQAIFCIDEREDSLRRHIENVDPTCETLGCPGFFGVEFFFQPFNGKFYEKLCPAPVTPKYLIKEVDVTDERHYEVMYSSNSHTLLKGVFASMSLGLLAGFKMIQNLRNPKMTPAISNAFAHMNINGKLEIENTNINNIENGLQLGFTIEEMALRVENLLRGIGLIKNFADLIYVVSHGSSSANNPHHGAHDCGACSGRPGATNARVFAHMANHPKVRAILASHGLVIPETSIFIGGMHDTAADEVAFYDETIIPSSLNELHKANINSFEAALDLNAKERSRRFASIDISEDIKHVRQEIKKRSVSFFEPRPELGHGTNALCFVGSRKLTKGLFLDRRAFMNSFDYTTDPEGNLLLGVMRPLPPVCGGINLEYYFSRIDNYKLGAGTKLPHNVVGLIGVANSSDGDLRPGLPLQMIEVHDPVRLMILVEHFPEVVLNTIKREESLYQWFDKEWVHLTAIHPTNGKYYYFRNGNFEEYLPIANIKTIDSDQHLIEKTKEMSTNYIVDATKENIPVHVIKNKDAK